MPGFRQLPPCPPNLTANLEARIDSCAGETESGDAIFWEDDRLDKGMMILLVDAAGHGATAARQIRLMIDGYLRDAETWNRTPAELLRTLHEFHAPNFDETFRHYTAVAILLPVGKPMQVCHAGDYPKLVGRLPTSSWEVLEGRHGPLLGVAAIAEPFEDVQHEAVVAVLGISDGVANAAPNGQGKSLREKDIAEWANGEMASRTSSLIAELARFVHAFYDGRYPVDDATYCHIDASVRLT